MTPSGASPRARHRIAWVISVVVAALLLVDTPAVADPYEEKARVDREIARTRAALEVASDRVASAVAAYEEATRRLPQVQARLADARAKLTAARSKSRAATLAATMAAKELSASERDVDQALRQVDEAGERIEEYAVTAFMGRDIAGVAALLSVSSPADFVAGYQYLDAVSQAQQQALDELSGARAEAQKRQEAQTGKARAAVRARRAANDALRQATAAEASAAQAQQDVNALIRQREAAKQQAEQERAATLARYRQLQEESARIAAEIRALAAGGGPVVRPGANLPMPVNGWKTSDFGMRYDPYYHVWQLHAGVDLAAAGGSPIWAVAPGKVFRAGWSGGYGNYTCIYHGLYQGKGFATCYAHQSTILATVGQQVRTGQVIGRVGSTGASTGNHLHFEIRLNGDPVDPWPWLT